MSSTRNLQASVGWVLPQIGYQPVNISGDDPALSAANLVKQTILGPPFVWRWNRSEASFLALPGAQDFPLSAPDFGFIERVSLTTSTGATVVKEVKIESSLSVESIQQRPASVAIQKDDNAGNLTFRFNSVPDQMYIATVQYQRKAFPMTSMAATWAPIPDESAYIYDWGLLAHLSMLVKDARFPTFRQTFTAHLIGAQDGLDALKRNIFLGNWIDVLTAPERAQQKVQQASAARQF